jgi:hypothetical protein
MGHDDGFDGFAEVVPHMPPVGYLGRVRGAGAGAFGVGASPVSADDLRAGVRYEPRG